MAEQEISRHPTPLTYTRELPTFVLFPSDQNPEEQLAEADARRQFDNRENAKRDKSEQRANLSVLPPFDPDVIEIPNIPIAEDGLEALNWQLGLEELYGQNGVSIDDLKERIYYSAYRRGITSAADVLREQRQFYYANPGGIEQTEDEKQEHERTIARAGQTLYMLWKDDRQVLWRKTTTDERDRAWNNALDEFPQFSGVASVLQYGLRTIGAHERDPELATQVFFHGIEPIATRFALVDIARIRADMYDTDEVEDVMQREIHAMRRELGVVDDPMKPNMQLPPGEAFSKLLTGELSIFPAFLHNNTSK